MQDIHTIAGAATIAAGGGGGGGGGGVSLFVSGSGGGGGGGDRRLRQITNQVLKCPRCDSSNTKFCYYNNYNLSQPRHFCKNCRRYWTKGGVLRNVPVGGGCRKAKRSKSKQSEDAVPVANNTEVESNSNSSSESSSLTGTTTTTTPAAKSSQEDASATATATVTVTVNSSNSSDNLLNFPQPSRFFLDQHQLSIFPETGSFMSLMTPQPGESSSPMPSPSLLGFNFADVSAYRMQQNSSLAEDHNSSNHMILTRGDEEYKMDQINYGYLDPTANIGFTSLQQSRVAIGGLAGLDWQINGVDGGGTGTDPDQGLFDFAGTDDQAYLSQTHWLDNDAPLNFPPLV